MSEKIRNERTGAEIEVVRIVPVGDGILIDFRTKGGVDLDRIADVLRGAVWLIPIEGGPQIRAKWDGFNRAPALVDDVATYWFVEVS